MNNLRRIIEFLLYLIIAYLCQKVTYYIYSYVILKLINDYNDAIIILQKTKGIYILIGWVITIILIKLSIKLSKYRYKNNLNNKLGLNNILFSIIIGFGMVFFVSGIIGLINLYYPLESFFENNDIIYSNNIIITILVVGVLIPLMEEIFFRGYILNKLIEIFSNWIAIIIQSIFFAFLHLNIIQGGYVFLLGLITGYSVAKTRSLKSAKLIHIIFNSTNIYLSYSNHQYSLGQFIFFMFIGFILIILGMDKLNKVKRVKLKKLL